MFKLAWLNIWRNRRRTIITISSIFFAVFFSILMRGFHMGQWLKLIDNVLHSYTGYVQIHAKDYWENKTFDYSLVENDSAIQQASKTDLVKNLIPRLESFSLASSGEKTKGVITIGIDPEKENEFTHLDKKIVSGRYFTSQDSGIILSQRLAKFLSIQVNDSLVLLSQGYQGASANGLFRVIGIVKLPSQEFDNQMIYMPLKLAQNFYSAEGRLTSFVVDLKDPNKMEHTVNQLQNSLDDKQYEVMSWKEMLIELYQQYVSDEGGGIIMLGLLYLIVGFGVFGTVLMMIAERKREFAIMVTVGMQKIKLVKLLGIELVYICFLGILFGFLGSIPIIAYFHFNPIQLSANLAEVYAQYGMEAVISVAWQTDYMFQQVINVSIIIFVVLLYPLFSIYKMEVVKALRR